LQPSHVVAERAAFLRERIIESVVIDLGRARAAPKRFPDGCWQSSEPLEST
jgi:hypothetical protein